MKAAIRNRLPRVGAMTIVSVISLVALGFLLGWHLKSLTPGWDSGEVAAAQASASLHGILRDPINAPFTVLANLISRLLPHSYLALRITSTLFGALAVCLFFFIVRSWHSARIAWLSSILFATSTWFLLSARGGTPDVLLFGLLILMALALWLQRSRHRRVLYVVMALACVIGLYVPGIIWFLLISAFWQRKLIRATLKRVPLWTQLTAVVLVLLLLAPLIWGVSHDWRLALNVFGLPSHRPSFQGSLRRLVDVPLNVFVRGPYHPGFWVGRTPLIDVFGTVLFIFGVYAYWQHRRLARVASLLSIFVITAVLIALGGPVSLSLLLPFVYLIIGTGLAFLLGEWLSVFPLNPLARGAGVVIVVVAVMLSATYQLDRYFVAWPKLPATKQAFQVPPPKT